MTDTEHARAQEEARETVTRASASASRQRLWAGLNRYLAAEGEHAREAARREAEAERENRPPA